MTEVQKNLLVGVAVGAVVCALAVASFDLFFRAEMDDEDRPPIIVRGGSLIFESDNSNGNAKDWQEKTSGSKSDWQPDHKRGKWVSWFVVEIEPATADCPAYSMTQKAVTFTHGNDTFIFEMKRAHHGNSGNSGRNTLTISGTGLDYPSGGKKTELVHQGNSTIDKVSFERKEGDTINCATPTRVVVWQF